VDLPLLLSQKPFLEHPCLGRCIVLIVSLQRRGRVKNREYLLKIGVPCGISKSFMVQGKGRKFIQKKKGSDSFFQGRLSVRMNLLPAAEGAGDYRYPLDVLKTLMRPLRA